MLYRLFYSVEAMLPYFDFSKPSSYIPDKRFDQKKRLLYQSQAKHSDR
jgi:hypothetical protein